MTRAEREGEGRGGGVGVTKGKVTSVAATAGAIRGDAAAATRTTITGGAQKSGPVIYTKTCIFQYF